MSLSFPMNLYFHPESDDWTARSYSFFGAKESMDEVETTIEARAKGSHKGVYFLLKPGFKPFWQVDKSGLGCTVCVDSEHFAKPADYVYKSGQPQPCVAYKACVVPRESVDLTKVYAAGMSMARLRDETRLIWRERSHDW